VKISIGPLTVLFFIFLVLKLTHVIAWAWWIVFIPLYPLGFGIAVVVLAAILTGLARLFESPEDRRRREALEAISGLRRSLRRR
jgi:uncharacterized membrane protein YqjE